MTQVSSPPVTGTRPVLSPITAVRMLILRNYLCYRKSWKLFLTGFFEPFFFLLSIGIGVGQLIKTFEVNGVEVSYAAFVAPAMLATSAMSGAMMDATYNMFFKLKYQKLYEQVLATPISVGDVARGEMSWCLIRGTTYAAFFLLIMALMGFVESWWGLLVLPASILIALAFATPFMWLTTYMKSWHDLDKLTVIEVPLFLFSATFFPLSALPTALQWLVEVSPLYRGVVLCRELTLGVPTWDSAISVIYLATMGGLGLWGLRRRLGNLLLN